MPSVNKYLCVGPGGRKCNCCFPPPGSKARRLEYRKAKRREKQDAAKLIFADSENEENS